MLELLIVHVELYAGYLKHRKAKTEAWILKTESGHEDTLSLLQDCNLVNAKMHYFACLTF